MNQWMPDHQCDALRALSRRSDLTMSEWLRRMVDHCLQEPVLNGLLPSMSGTLAASLREGER